MQKNFRNTVISVTIPKKRRYLQLYVPTEELDELVERLGKERYIKKIRRCHIQELETPFVGNLYRNEENVII